MQERANYNNLTLYTSEDCNLSCSYCEIAKSKKKNIVNNHINNLIKESMQSGQFTKNVLTVVKNLKANMDDFETLELWGQEPTLTIDAFKTMMPDILLNFKNIHAMFFSTNGVGHINDLLCFVEKLDTLNFVETQKKIDGKFQLRIQFSYDGIYSTKNFRGIEPTIILNNIRYFIEHLNFLYFYNIEVNLSFHNVISRKLIEELNTRDKIKEFWKELKDLSIEFSLLNKNSNVKISHFAPGIENPVNASSEEGKALANFYQISKEVGKELQWDGMYGMVGQNLHAIRMAERGYRRYYDLSRDDKFSVVSNEKFIQNILYLTMLAPLDDKSRLLINQLSDVYCTGFKNGVKVRYNGDYVHCQNCIHQLKADNLTTDTIEQLNAKAMAKNHFYPNLLEPNEEFDNKKYHIAIANSSSFCHNYTEVLNMMYLALQANQIDSSYKDKNKMVRHAFYLTFMNTCFDDEIKTSNSVVSRYPGHIRYYCNGFLDEIENYHLTRLKKNKNMVLAEKMQYKENENIALGLEER